MSQEPSGAHRISPHPDPLPEGEGAYKAAGVDIDAGNRAVDLIKEKVRSTFGPQVLTGIGGFGSLFAFGGYREPVLVASADGVGTKLKIAIAMDRHDTVGIDLVNHCVNDILTTGATPLFFLDYVAMGKLHPDRIAALVSGLAEACRANGCALVGGETAEMPGIYSGDDYDLAGFIVGAVERDRVVDGSRIEAGDLIWGLPSSGLHTNGYSLVRKLLQGEPLDRFWPELGRTLGDELLEPHRCYLESIKRLLAPPPAGDGEMGRQGDGERGTEPLPLPLPAAGRGEGWGAGPGAQHPAPSTQHSAVDVKGMAHITGGGIPGNVARIVPTGMKALFHWGRWPVPAVFRAIQERGKIAQEEMLRVFNLGLGYVVICPSGDRERLQSLVPEAMLVGEIVATEGGERVEVVSG